MTHGKVRDALRLLKEGESAGVLDLNLEFDGKTILDILRDKHPSRSSLKDSALVDPNQKIPPSHVTEFEAIDGSMIRRIVLRQNGSGGPSGIDSACWRHFCTGYKSYSQDLCISIAMVARRLASCSVDPKGIVALTSCRLVPLDKNPGVRPIGICEVLRRIISKSILSVVSYHITCITKVKQLCTGIESGCEAAVHAINASYINDAHGVLLVDASNAFNSLNRNTALVNISRLCPIFATTVKNMYLGEAPLCVGGEILKSSEGTTQGDPLSMPIYALATTPLIDRINWDNVVKQVWYADDSAPVGNIDGLRL
ncbi:Uncharacterised protein r2_g545 [Pycnogonum litorale]